MSIVRILLLSVLAIVFVSCSSAPPPKEEEVVQKNQAAQFAESGNKYYNEGSYEQALSFFRLSLSYNGSIYNERGMIESYNSIGKTYIAIGSLDLANAAFASASELATLTGDKELIAICLNNQAELAIVRKLYEKAHSLLIEALTAGSGIKPQRLSVIYHNLGLAQKRLGNLDDAISNFKIALGINLSNKYYIEAASNYYMLSSSYSEKNEYAIALDYAHKALDLDKKFENSLGIAKDYFALGILSGKSGNDRDAFRYYGSSLFIYDSLTAIKPALLFKEDKKALLDALIRTATKLGDNNASIEYGRLRKELDK